MKKTVILGVVIALFSIGFVVAGAPDFQAVGVRPSNGHAIVNISGNAVEVAPGVFSLGSATDVDGRIVEGFMFVDYGNKKERPR